MLSSNYPPAAFHFSVGLGPLGFLGVDAAFREVSGIVTELETEAIQEGGQSFVYNLPKGITHPRLVLKRGIAPIYSPLVNWCRTVFEEWPSSRIETQPVQVSLLDESGWPLRVWTFDNAYPVRWEVEGFQSTKNEVAVEKIELSYTGSSRML
jgi:phage tail-like protein